MQIQSEENGAGTPRFRSPTIKIGQKRVVFQLPAQAAPIRTKATDFLPKRRRMSQNFQVAQFMYDNVPAQLRRQHQKPPV